MSIITEDIFKLKKPRVRAPIHPLFVERFSPRIYSSEMIPDDTIASFFEAARWAPSSYNRQPWFFYYAKKGSDGFGKLSLCLSESNTAWATKAPLLILACYINEDERGINAVAQYDLGQAVMSLVIQAQSMGYYTHEMGGFDKKRAKELLKIQDPIAPFVMIAVGKLGEYKNADQALVEKDSKERVRKTDIARQI